ncbi:MAG: hypothetical protein O3B86_06120, partial [Planctomycetota bacterium]|nr:hypothetical protein [Planctomycetota bacterium]
GRPREEVSSLFHELSDKDKDKNGGKIKLPESDGNAPQWELFKPLSSDIALRLTDEGAQIVTEGSLTPSSCDFKKEGTHLKFEFPGTPFIFEAVKRCVLRVNGRGNHMVAFALPEQHTVEAAIFDLKKRGDSKKLAELRNVYDLDWHVFVCLDNESNRWNPLHLDQESQSHVWIKGNKPEFDAHGLLSQLEFQLVVIPENDDRNEARMIKSMSLKILADNLNPIFGMPLGPDGKPEIPKLNAIRTRNLGMIPGLRANPTPENGPELIRMEAENKLIAQIYSLDNNIEPDGMKWFAIGFEKLYGPVSSDLKSAGWKKQPALDVPRVIAGMALEDLQKKHPKYLISPILK